jgi:putative transposase
VKYQFIEAHRQEHAVRTMCRVLNVHPSGFYSWLKTPLCDRALRDARQIDLAKRFWFESGGIYGYRKIRGDLLSMGERCGKHRAARLMRLAGLRALVGYGRRPRVQSGPPAIVAPNHLQRDFDAQHPDQAWVTDITYIRTYEGWLYLAVVVDLFSRRVVGWSMSSRIQTDLVLQALLHAVWRRKPDSEVVVHSDQGSQYTSQAWQRFLGDHGLLCSMSRRGNCWDNAVAESFFQLLKREKIKRRIYSTRAEARADVFNYIEMFYNPKRRHGNNGNVSPADYEKDYYSRLESV